MNAEKSLDQKLVRLRLAEEGTTPPIICYAADPDMGGGLRPTVAQGVTPEAWRQQMADMIEAADIDILLASVSSMDHLARRQRLFDGSPVTPAIRANDTTDIWHVRGGTYTTEPSRPFATTTVREAMYGTLSPKPDQAVDVPLGLWSITFNNDLAADERSLLRYREFRAEAAEHGFRHFVEVFNPNVADPGIDGPVGSYVNDCIARMLAGVPAQTGPEFLKVVYNGAEALQELVSGLDIPVGVLGGPPSTTNDSFTLAQQVKQNGGRVMLFGRRIKVADDPVLFTKYLRLVADGNRAPEDATREYHAELVENGITPSRPLGQDLVIETPELLV